MWTHTFHKTDQEHKASLGALHQANCTQAGGAMDRECQDKKPERHNHEDDNEYEYEDENAEKQQLKKQQLMKLRKPLTATGPI